MEKGSRRRRKKGWEGLRKGKSKKEQDEAKLKEK